MGDTDDYAYFENLMLHILCTEIIQTIEELIMYSTVNFTFLSISGVILGH